ncbi:interferon-inducible GTPase 5-like isoform X1 [Gopherus flavomarginatus]|uniref:interferon-inducible GTPase 5-like isoform X1 n=2 Tax=Gopherus flavomarginatus TaxID=286002 RepID=UPI0021CBFADC|nr:interferon-inducible GTPase 5-like isoform X1 [Gopherus flavomarginatus]
MAGIGVSFPRKMAGTRSFWADLFLEWGNNLNGLSHEEYEEFQAAVCAGNLAEAIAVVKKSDALLKNTKLDVAITGEQGSGKSSFINAIRNLADDDEGAAETEVIESVKEPTPYPHPKHPNVTMWDLPGIGTPNYPTNTYVEKVDFAHYDFFIIITAGRFRESDASLAQEIQRMGKKFYFVRSKVDMDLRSERKGKTKVKEETVLQTIRNDCIRNLQEADILSPQVFLVSRWDFEKYDAPQLQETFSNELDTHRRHAIFHVLLRTSEQPLNWKKEALEQQIWKQAFNSGAIATIPLPFLSVWWDVGILVDNVTKFCESFGLDDYSLRALEKPMGKSSELRTVIQFLLAKDRSRDEVFKLLKEATGQVMMIAKYFISMIPGIGTAIAAVTSYRVTGRLLRTFVAHVAEDAQRVLKRALEGAEKRD